MSNHDRPAPPRGRTLAPAGEGAPGVSQEWAAVVTATAGYPSSRTHLLMVGGPGGGGWALPSGHLEPGDDGAAAAARKLAEETGLAVPPGRARPMPPRRDPADSVIIVAVLIDLGPLDRLPPMEGGGPQRAEWMPAASCAALAAWVAARYGGRLSAAHAPMLAELLG